MKHAPLRLAALLLALAAPLRAQCEDAELYASDVEADDSFGVSIDADGDRIVVGAYKADAGSDNDVGAAYVYVRQGDAWVEEAILVAPGLQSEDQFGVSVAIEGDRIAVGAPYLDGTIGFNEGRVFVWEHDGLAWQYLTALQPADLDAENWFGLSLDLDGDRLLVGAGRDSDIKPDAGAAYVFRRDPGGWVEEAKINHPDVWEGDTFGSAVALDGDVALIGAPFHDTVDQGAAYAFERAGTSWVEIGEVVPGAPNTGANFGCAVDVDGDVALVGARYWGLNAKGRAYVLRRSGSSWSQEAILNPPDLISNDNFGYSVALDGDHAYVSAPRKYVNTSRQGVIYTFVYDGGSWVQDGELIAFDPKDSDELGSSLAISPNWIVAGAPENKESGGDSGRAIAFARGADLVKYGEATPGANGWQPLLEGYGCPNLGTTSDIRIKQVVGAAPGALALGTAPAAFPVFGGTLLVDSIFGTTSHVVGGSAGVPGAGSVLFTIPAPTEPALVGAEVFAQAGYLDAEAPQGISMTNGLRIRIGTP